MMRADPVGALLLCPQTACHLGVRLQMAPRRLAEGACLPAGGGIRR
jgi:hypothetical protein